MTTITAKLHRGSKTDPTILLIGILIVFAGFLTLYDTDFWKSSKVLWQPITLLGSIILITNKFIQKFRSSLNINLLTNNENSIIIEPIKKIIFSGWVVEPTIRIEKQSIKSLKIFDFSDSGIPAPGLPAATGMYWVCFELNDRSIIEFDLNNYETIKEIISFATNHLPDTKLIIDKEIKI